jgi:hypothetical protein
MGLLSLSLASLSKASPHLVVLMELSQLQALAGLGPLQATPVEPSILLITAFLVATQLCASLAMGLS